MKRDTIETMRQVFRWLYRHAGVLIVLFFLAVHLVVMPDYGFTWDFHFHFFGGGKLLGIEPAVLEPRPLPFVEPDPRRAWTLPYGPIMSIPPVASYMLFHKTLSLLPADVSYHLPIVIWGVAGIGILFAFMKEAAGIRTALLAAIFLALTPRYFGDLHNNMKDVPSAVMFCVNVWLLWRLYRKRRVIDLLAAVAACAVAFSVKINAVFIPVVFAAFLIVTKMLFPAVHVTKRMLVYFLLSPVAAFLLWWAFWSDPIGQLKHAYLTFGVGTNNIEVLLNGAWYCSGSTVPRYYPFWYLGIVTPLPILALFVAGAVISGVSIARFRIRIGDSAPPQSVLLPVLLALWLTIPLTRYLFPSVGVIDGIRHFEEVLFPIAALAALGADALITHIRNRRLRLIAVLFVLISLAANIVTHHPFQIAFFNGLIGGVQGAVGKYDLDYWGTSQKAAVEWVNRTAAPNASVHIVMAAAVAGQYLRPDLLANLNSKSYTSSDYVILLNRTSFLYRFFYAYDYFLTHRPAHTITVRGAPLVWIYDNRQNNMISRQEPFWKDEDPCIRKYWRGELP